MKVSPLANLNAARKQWTERRRELAAGMVQGAASLSLSDDSLSEQFIQAQTMIEAIGRAIKHEEELLIEDMPATNANKLKQKPIKSPD